MVAQGLVAIDSLEARMDVSQSFDYRLHLRNESAGQTLNNVPTLVLENLSSFLQNCQEHNDNTTNNNPIAIQQSQHFHQQDHSKLPIEWVHTQPNFTSGRSPEVLKMKARDLIQQEKCEASYNYCVDQPSQLVRIECLKPGCKCVLKHEPALALKIICGVSLIRGSWSNLQAQNPISSTPHHSAKWGSFSSAFERLNGRGQAPAETEPQIPLIFTSCSPFWFEILAHQNDVFRKPEIAAWTSGKALWKSRPTIFLLRKLTKCILSVSSQNSRGPVTLDLDNVVNLHPGTVLRLLDCKTCRVVSKTNSQCPASASLLQCEVVGSKALAKYASMANNLSPDDALYWFASGPRLVYLPLDDRSVSFFPIANPPPNSREIKNPNWAHSGAHSVLTLLSYFPLPLTVRPVMEHSLANWLTTPSCSIRDGSAGLHLTSCYHGDLVFLEPIADCSPAANNGNSSSSSSSGGNSRFFVVTAEMLSQHRFILATPQSSQFYARELKTHASRVAHFLAAFHPACGLNYLLKYLEDVTHCSSVGPSHRPLTETLGPLGGDGTIASHTSVASIAASLLLHLDIDERAKSPDVLALYDNLDDIYQYVRTGRLPTKVRAPSAMQRSCSATPGAISRGRGRQDYTVPYVYFPETSFVSNHSAHPLPPPPPPPPPPRRSITTTHSYVYPPAPQIPSNEECYLKSDVPASPQAFVSPRHRRAYVDYTRFRSIEQQQQQLAQSRGCCGQPPTSYSILNFAGLNDRTNSSPDTGLGGDSGQSGQSLVVPTATTSIVRSSCYQLINFCENGNGSPKGQGNEAYLKSPQLLYPNLRKLAVNLNKRVL